jgi:hypothetical protein
MVEALGDGLPAVVATGILLNDDAMDTANFDSLPWNHDLNSDDDSMADTAAFHDALGWESDGDVSVELVRATL